jgi:uncharacterized protein (DUF952 family)
MLVSMALRVRGRAEARADDASARKGSSTHAKLIAMTRWLYHLAQATEADRRPYTPDAFASEGFVHASFAPAVAESHRLYLAADPRVRVLCIDPRLLHAEVRVVETPRGPMPHIHGPVNAEAIVDVLDASSLTRALPDQIE